MRLHFIKLYTILVGIWFYILEISPCIVITFMCIFTLVQSLTLDKSCLPRSLMSIVTSPTPFQSPPINIYIYVSVPLSISYKNTLLILSLKTTKHNRWGLIVDIASLLINRTGILHSGPCVSNIVCRQKQTLLSLPGMHINKTFWVNLNCR